ncbi:MAG: hypothetical protein IMZ64_06200 [Bacteroidetes bacterium]|nr:hypothetical protein [Bacteroidota bacterium]MBE3140984.1 hypothetical protein [Thermoplasmata archaeon]
MKMIIAIIAIVLIIAAAVGIYVVTSTTNLLTEPIINPPAQSSGGWGQELSIAYADGHDEIVPLTTSPLSAGLLSWFRDGQAIIAINYRIYSCVKTLDTEATTIEYQHTDAIHLSVKVTTGSTTVYDGPFDAKYNVTIPIFQQTTPPTDPTSDQYTRIYGQHFLLKSSAYHFPTVPGTYTFTFTPSGSLQYKTNVMTAWETVPGPTTPITLQLTLNNALSFYWNPSTQ